MIEILNCRDAETNENLDLDYNLEELIQKHMIQAMGKNIEDNELRSLKREDLYYFVQNMIKDVKEKDEKIEYYKNLVEKLNHNMDELLGKMKKINMALENIFSYLS